MGEYRLTSVWCIPAEASDAVLVLARYSDGRMGWTHLMRWTPGRSLEAGAWARLQLSRALCRVDASGEFLQYHAKNRVGGAWDEQRPKHFRASLGGGWAISRAPWLSALTDIKGWSVGTSRVDTSVHALPPREQRKLEGKFGAPQGYWFLRQQPGWRAIGAVDEHGELLHRSSRWEGEQTARTVPGALLVRVPGGFPPDFGAGASSPKFSWRDGRGVEHQMKDVAWARLRPGGGLLWATHDGWIRSAERRAGGVLAGWESEWRVVEEQDCSHREPAPGPSPEWARARL